MPDFRVHRPPSPQPAAEFVLSPEESHHLVAVNRARAGDTVIAFDGRGTEWTCVVVHDRKNGATLRVQATHARPPRAFALTLAQAMPKGPAMDAIVRKATELGAARLVPLHSDRTQVHLDDDRSDRKHDKWRTAALEAAKQCGNPYLPEIAPLQAFADFLRHDPAELKLIASLQPGAQPLPAALAAFHARHARWPRTAAWVIGPEGDFSPAELAAATAAGFAPVTLGPLVLRADTAATCALALLDYELRHRLGGA